MIDEAQVLERLRSIYERFVVRAELEPLRKNCARVGRITRVRRIGRPPRFERYLDLPHLFTKGKPDTPEER
jgi:hypothetical protein